MHRSFATVVAPIVESVQPRTIAEVGAGAGRLTNRLLAFPGAAGATVHAIDPRPAFDPDDIAPGDARLRMHPERSLEALSRIEALDLALLDGDPNWFTVHAELELLAAMARGTGCPMPIVVVHNVHWPFGRRDGYHDPDGIPGHVRRPYAAGGLRPTSAEPEPGGLRLVPFAAVHEHGERNGVLTAVEDFVAADSERWQVLDVPGFHGTAVLVAASTAAALPALRGVLGALETPATLRRVARRAEAGRVEALLAETLHDGARDDAMHEAARWRLRTLERDLAARDAERREAVASRDAHVRAAVEAGVRHERAVEDLRAARNAAAASERESAELRETLSEQQRRVAELEAREQELHTRAVRLEQALVERRREYDEIARHVKAAAASRSWRWGHGFTRVVRSLTFRRSVKSDGALDVAVRAVERVQITGKASID